MEVGADNTTNGSDLESLIGELDDRQIDILVQLYPNLDQPSFDEIASVIQVLRQNRRVLGGGLYSSVDVGYDTTLGISQQPPGVMRDAVILNFYLEFFVRRYQAIAAYPGVRYVMVQPMYIIYKPGDNSQQVQYHVSDVHGNPGSDTGINKAGKNKRSSITFIIQQDKVLRLDKFHEYVARIHSLGSDVSVLIVGFIVTVVNNVGVQLSNDDLFLNALRAFRTVEDRKYHELTTASTDVDSSMCIYETFMHNAGLNPIRGLQKSVARRKRLHELFSQESSEIQSLIRSGQLIGSLRELCRKYQVSMAVSFYQARRMMCYSGATGYRGRCPVVVHPDGSVEKHWVLPDSWVGREIMLYHPNEHVAPAKYKKPAAGSEKKPRKFSLDTLKCPADGSFSYYTFDIETFNDVHCRAIPFCICVYSVDECKYFYGLDCVTKFVQWIDSIVTKTAISKSRSKGSVEQMYMYGFNNSAFDNQLILEELFKLNHSMEFISTGSSIKTMRYFNMTFFDIRLQYAGSLASVLESMKIPIRKLPYPYQFPNAENIENDYVGPVPSEQFWKRSANSTDGFALRQQYIEANGPIFDLRKYTIEYCAVDVIATHAIVSKHLQCCIGYVYRSSCCKQRPLCEICTLTRCFCQEPSCTKCAPSIRHYDVRTCGTAAKMSMTIFRQTFLNEALWQSPEDIIAIERLAYKGGRTEVFKKKFSTDNANDKCMYYYDINSSYPSSMRELMPMKSSGIRCDSFDARLDNIKSHWLYECTATSDGCSLDFIPNLLYRMKDGGIAAVRNIDLSWHWGCELLEAIRNGCQIHVMRHIEYTSSPVFQEFTDYFYDERLKSKAEGNIVMTNYYKLLLNSFYGKFGQRAFNQTIAARSIPEALSKIASDQRYPISFQTVTDSLCIVEFEEEAHSAKSIGKLVRFASYITALSRCKLSKFMRAVGHSNVYYCDTDSVFTTVKPPDKFVHSSDLGKWKLEDNGCCIYEAVFIAPKSYAFSNFRGYPFAIDKPVKSKGLPKGVAKYDDMIALSSGADPIKKELTMFDRNLTQVHIYSNKIRTLQCVYTKRRWNGNDSQPYTDVQELTIARRNQ